MTDTMVERVARHIHTASGNEPEDWAYNPHLRDLARKQALAAIKAMREPSKGMLVSAGTMEGYDLEEAEGRMPDLDHTEWWQAMIDAALSEKPK